MQKVVCKFCAEGFLQNETPSSSRPVEVNSDQIKTLL